MSLLFALALLAVMGLAGIALLRRGAPFLDPLEHAAYGIPLGMVVATGAILLLCDATGSIALPQVLGGTAVVALVAAIAISGRRLVDPGPDGALRRSLAAGRGALRGARLRPGRTGGWLAVIVIAAFALRWTLYWPNAVQLRPDGLWAGHVNVWGDWPVHLGIVTSFVDGANFPPTHPRFVGHAFGYHYLSDLTAAALVPLGLGPDTALELHSLVLSIVAAIALYAFARRVTGSTAAGAVAVVLFLLGGGLGWINTIRGALGDAAGLPTPGTLPWDYRWKTESNFQWVNMFWGFWMSQRAFLYGMPMAFAILRIVLEARRVASLRLWIVGGLIAGLLPLAHLATLFALALVVPVLFLLFPAWGWFAFGIVWVAVAFPQLLSLGGGGAGALSALRVQLGWVSGPDPWPVFWLKNQGAFLVLGIAGLAWGRALPAAARRLLLAFWVIFGASNVLVFQPWDWDNHKVLVYWFLAVAIGSAAALVALWNRWRSALPRLGILVVVATMVASGVLEDATQAMGLSSYRMLDNEQIRLAALVRDATPPRSVFQTGMDNHDPVAMLAGRRLYVGYENWLWTEGIPYAGRRAEALTILRWGPEAEQLLARSPIDFVVIGPMERTELGANEDAFRSRFPIVVQTERYRVYDVRSAHRG